MANQLHLGVNIDHSATVRQARYRDEAQDCGGNVEPDPVALAFEAERAGADAITLHLREDRRHIQESDVRRLREAMVTRMNLEMACTESMIAFALEIRPECVLLVPEGREEVTTEGGLDVKGRQDRVRQAVKTLKAAGIEVSLFIDTEEAQIRASAEVEADMVELHTGPFAHARTGSSLESEVIRLIEGATTGHELGLSINAGHGLNYHNLKHLLRVPHLHELNIGHSIISRSLFTGIRQAVMDMKALMAPYKR